MRKRDWKVARNWLAKEVREKGLTKTKAFKNQQKYKRLRKQDLKREIKETDECRKH